MRERIEELLEHLHPPRRLLSTERRQERRGQAEQLGEEVVDAEPTIVERPVGRPWIGGMKVDRPHAAAGGDRPAEADRAQGLQPVGVLERTPEVALGDRAAAEAVISNRRRDLRDRLFFEVGTQEIGRRLRASNAGQVPVGRVLRNVHEVVQERREDRVAHRHLGGEPHRPSRHAGAVFEIVRGIRAVLCEGPNERVAGEGEHGIAGDLIGDVRGGLGHSQKLTNPVLSFRNAVRRVGRFLARRGGALVALGALVYVAFGTSAPASAQLEIAWEAPEDCPDADELRRRVRASLGADVDVPLRVSGQLRPEAEGWVLELRVGDGERVLRGQSCSALTDAAAFITALALHPDVRGRDPAGGETEAEPTPEQWRLAVRDEVATRLSPPAGGVPDRADEPTLDEPDEPNPVAPNPDAPNPDAPNPDASNPDAPNPDAPNPDDPEPSVNVPLDLLQGAALHLSSGLEFGSLPSPSPRFDLGARWPVRTRGLLGIGLMAVLPKSAAALPHPSARGRVWLASAVFEGGVVRTFRRFSAEAAGITEFGWMVGSGHGVSEPGRGRSVWFAAGIAARAGVRLGHRWRLAFEGDLRIPLLRPGFGIEGAGEVHRVPSIVGRAGIDLSVHFR